VLLALQTSALSKLIINYLPLPSQVHHEYTAPFALAGEHAHPIEAIFGFLFPMIVAFVVQAYIAPMSLVVVWGSISIQHVRSIMGR